MEGSAHKVLIFSFNDEDILFDCPVCGKSCIIESTAAGMELACPQCQSVLRVPGRDQQQSSARIDIKDVKISKEVPVQATTPPPAAQPKAAVAPPDATPAVGPVTFDASKLDHLPKDQLEARHKELLHLMKENHSQRLEVNEYISHANLKLQRETLKLKKLEAKKLDYEAEIAALKIKLGL